MRSFAGGALSNYQASLGNFIQRIDNASTNPNDPLHDYVGRLFDQNVNLNAVDCLTSVYNLVARTRKDIFLNDDTGPLRLIAPAYQDASAPAFGASNVGPTMEFTRGIRDEPLV